jgi:hypothetical protein
MLVLTLHRFAAAALDAVELYQCQEHEHRQEGYYN